MSSVFNGTFVPMERFHGGNQDWTEWKETFSSYLIRCGVIQPDECDFSSDPAKYRTELRKFQKQRLAFLVDSFRDDAQRTYRMLPEAERVDFDKVCAKMQSTYSLHPVSAFEKFCQRRMGPSESLESFMMSLYSLMELAVAPENVETFIPLLKLQFCLGLPDGRVKETCVALCRPGKTFDEIVSVARDMIRAQRVVASDLAFGGIDSC